MGEADAGKELPEYQRNWFSSCLISCQNIAFYRIQIILTELAVVTLRTFLSSLPFPQISILENPH